MSYLPVDMSLTFALSPANISSSLITKGEPHPRRLARFRWGFWAGFAFGALDKRTPS